MTTAWMIYAIVISLPIALAAWATARWLRRYGVAERFVWSAALLVILAVPAWRLIPDRDSQQDLPTAAPAQVVTLDIGLPATVGVREDGMLERASGMVGWAWLALSLLLGVRVGRSWWTLARERARWTEAGVAGATVFLSDDVGPAVFGVVRPTIVLPRWMRDLPADQLTHIVRHEIEHVRAKDPLVLATVLGLRIALPWHPGIWFLTGGLLEAIEIDCDRRVLRDRHDVRVYGTTVLAVASRVPTGRRQPVAAFTEPVRSMERRLIAMTQPRRAMGRLALFALVAVAAVALVGACETPLPSSPEASAAQETDENEGSALGDEPVFTPYTVAPRIINTDEVGEALDRQYPRSLREAGIAGSVVVWCLIDETGVVREVKINESSGVEELDRAALTVAKGFLFTPAQNRGEDVPVWISIPVTFSESTARQEEIEEFPGPGERIEIPPTPEELEENPVRELRPPPEDPGELSEQPVFTPFTVPPRLTNPQEVQRALLEAYPQSLRDAGIGGATNVWFFIDTQGVVQDTRINESSGNTELDRAALSVARVIRFTPAQNMDTKVPVWISIPITFVVQSESTSTPITSDQEENR